MKRLPPEVRRIVILKAALKAISVHGIHNLTLFHVSQRAEVETSIGTIRRYFKDREALFNGLLDFDDTSDDLITEIKRCGYV